MTDPSLMTAQGGLTLHGLNGTFGCRRHERGVYNAAVDKTVICWNGEGMSIYVREFDHKARSWSDAVRVRSLNYTATWDYHNYPCIVIAPDGRYLIFHCQHSKAAYVVASPEPGRIDGPWSYTEISSDCCCYPMPVVVADALYFFYSVTLTRCYRSYRMIQSGDIGRTWSEPVTLIDSGGKEEEGYDEVYAHGFSVDKGGPDQPARIILGWEMAGGPNGHNRGGRGSFCASFNCQDRKMYTAGGTCLGATIDLKGMFDCCLISGAKSPDGRLFGYTTYPALLPDGGIAVLYTLGGRAYIAVCKHDKWETSDIGIQGAIRDYRRTPAGAYAILSGDKRSVTVWESADGVTGWMKKSVMELPPDGNIDQAAKGFIDDFRPEVQWMACTCERENAMKDYSGKWPVYTFGTGTGAENEGDVLPGSLVTQA